MCGAKIRKLNSANPDLKLRRVRVSSSMESHEIDGKSIENTRYSFERSHVSRGSAVLVLYSKGHHKTLAL